MKRFIGAFSLIIGWGLFLAGIVKAVLVNYPPPKGGEL